MVSVLPACLPALLAIITICHSEELVGPQGFGTGGRGDARALVGLWQTPNAGQKLGVPSRTQFWYLANPESGQWFLFGSIHAGLEAGSLYIKRDTVMFSLNSELDRLFKRPFTLRDDTLTFLVGSTPVRFVRAGDAPDFPF